MKTIFIAFRLLWKRKFANLTLILQILFSVFSLAQLFVFIADHTDNMRAVNELPIENTVAVSVFNYRSSEQAEQQIASSPFVASIGKAYLSGLPLNGVDCNLAVYHDAIVERYAPALQAGVWFSSGVKSSGAAIEAVVSGDVGLKLGDTAQLLLPGNRFTRIVVTGVLKEPTQYFFPSGSASPEYFSARMVISQEPAVILREIDIEDLTGFDPPSNLFVFLQPNTPEAVRNSLAADRNVYGEVTPMPSLVATYNQNTKTMIGLGAITFIVFLAAAATGVLGNNVMQSMRNRKLFTVYYLLGMDWKRGVWIEISRVTVLLLLTMGLCVVAGRYGLLMLDWMTPLRAVLFYGIVFLYVLVMFTAVGAGFLVKLMREDISTSLKELHQGE